MVVVYKLLAFLLDLVDMCWVFVQFLVQALPKGHNRDLTTVGLSPNGLPVCVCWAGMGRCSSCRTSLARFRSFPFDRCSRAGRLPWPKSLWTARGYFSGCWPYAAIETRSEIRNASWKLSQHGKYSRRVDCKRFRPRSNRVCSRRRAFYSGFSSS